MKTFIFLNPFTGEQFNVTEVCSENEARFFLRKEYAAKCSEWLTV